MRNKRLINTIVTIITCTIVAISNVSAWAKLEVEKHIIDSTIEIAGGLNVKELIVVKGSSEHLNRKLNYYSFGDTKWDGKEKIDFNGCSFYNAHNINITEVAAVKYDKEIDINDLTKNKIEDLKEFDISHPSNKGYSYKDNKKGEVDLKILYPFEEKIAFFINYTIGNAIVKHDDIKELNYTFKNLNYDCKKTIVRVITPYQVEKDDGKIYNVWIHGSQNGKFQEMQDQYERKLGVYGEFSQTNEFNIRMTLPQQYVGIDMYLNNSKLKALDKIKKIEEMRLGKTKQKNTVLNNTIYALSALSIIYILTSIILSLKHIIDRKIEIILAIFSIIICIFNYLFYNFTYWYIYLVLLMPFLTHFISKSKK